MVVTEPSHQHRHHRDRPSGQTRWQSLRGTLRHWRFALVGCSFILVAAFAFFARYDSPLFQAVQPRYRLPSLIAHWCLGIIGGLSLLCGAVVLRWEYRGRLLAVIGFVVLLVGVGMFGGKALYGFLQHELARPEMALATNSPADPPASVSQDSPAPSFVVLMLIYATFSLLSVLSFRKLMKGHRHAHHRHHQARLNPQPAEESGKE
jgi:hypothetical protein